MKKFYEKPSVFNTVDFIMNDVINPKEYEFIHTYEQEYKIVSSLVDNTMCDRHDLMYTNEDKNIKIKRVSYTDTYGEKKTLYMIYGITSKYFKNIDDINIRYYTSKDDDLHEIKNTAEGMDQYRVDIANPKYEAGHTHSELNVYEYDLLPQVNGDFFILVFPDIISEILANPRAIMPDGKNYTEYNYDFFEKYIIPDNYYSDEEFKKDHIYFDYLESLKDFIDILNRGWNQKFKLPYEIKKNNPDIESMNSQLIGWPEIILAELLYISTIDEFSNNHNDKIWYSIITSYIMSQYVGIAEIPLYYSKNYSLKDHKLIKNIDEIRKLEEKCLRRFTDVRTWITDYAREFIELNDEYSSKTPIEQVECISSVERKVSSGKD